MGRGDEAKTKEMYRYDGQDEGDRPDGEDVYGGIYNHGGSEGLDRNQ